MNDDVDTGNLNDRQDVEHDDVHFGDGNDRQDDESDKVNNGDEDGGCFGDEQYDFVRTDEYEENVENFVDANRHTCRLGEHHQ